jgi:hypothetical protein
MIFLYCKISTIKANFYNRKVSEPTGNVQPAFKIPADSSEKMVKLFNGSAMPVVVICSLLNGNGS